MEIRINLSTSYPLYFDSTGNRKLLQSDLSFRSKSDNKAFLLIRLKKYLNPHENSCSKVICILINGNILHESSSAPQQHKSVQYKWFANVLTPRCFAYRHAATTFYQLQRGFGGQEATCDDPRIFVSFI